MRSFWIGIVSKERVDAGVAGGFVEMPHNKGDGLRQMRADDRLILYSPRAAYPDGDLLQAFTAIGTVRTGEVYPADTGEAHAPVRVAVAFAPCREAPIRPLLDRLSFVWKKDQWGEAFRFGYMQVPGEDFRTIARAMGAEAVAG